MLQHQILPKYSPATSKGILNRKLSFYQDNSLVWYEYLNRFWVNGVFKQYHSDYYNDNGLVGYEYLNRFSVNALWKPFH